jgi:hypothetical protein
MQNIQILKCKNKRSHKNGLLLRQFSLCKED